MSPDAIRTLVLLVLVILGFAWWPFSRESVAIGCWICAAVYALATNPRRWL